MFLLEESQNSPTPPFSPNFQTLFLAQSPFLPATDTYCSVSCNNIWKPISNVNNNPLKPNYEWQKN